MTTFEERLISEQYELQEKISKLSTFIKSDGFSKIDLEQAELLKKQLPVMISYDEILIYRLELLGISKKN